MVIITPVAGRNEQSTATASLPSVLDGTLSVMRHGEEVRSRVRVSLEGALEWSHGRFQRLFQLAEALPDVWLSRGGLAGGRVGAGRRRTMHGNPKRDRASRKGSRKGLRKGSRAAFRRTDPPPQSLTRRREVG